MKGTKKYGNKIFIITENQTNALREEINIPVGGINLVHT